MTAADIAPWISPAVILVLFAWLRIDLGRRIDRLENRLDQRIDGIEQSMKGLDDRLRSVEIAVGAMAAKLDLLERYFLRRNDPDSDPPPVAAE